MRRVAGLRDVVERADVESCAKTLPDLRADPDPDPDADADADAARWWRRSRL